MPLACHLNATSMPATPNLSSHMRLARKTTSADHQCRPPCAGHSAAACSCNTGKWPAAPRATHSCRDARRSWGQAPLDREHSATAVVDMGSRDASVTTCQSYSLGTSEWLRAVALAAQQDGVASDPLAYYDHVEVTAAAPSTLTLTAPTLTAPTFTAPTRISRASHGPRVGIRRLPVVHTRSQSVDHTRSQSVDAYKLTHSTQCLLVAGAHPRGSVVSLWRSGDARWQQSCGHRLPERAP